MTTPAPPHICQWCRHPITPDTARWWDNKPECIDQAACDRRTVRSQP